MTLFNKIKDNIMKKKANVEEEVDNLELMRSSSNEALTFVLLDTLEQEKFQSFEVNGSEDVIKGLKMIYEQAGDSKIETTKSKIEKQIAEMSVGQFFDDKNPTYQQALEKYNAKREELLEDIEHLKEFSPEFYNKFFQNLKEASGLTRDLMIDGNLKRFVRLNSLSTSNIFDKKHELWICPKNVFVLNSKLEPTTMLNPDDCKKLDDMLGRRLIYEEDKFNYYDYPQEYRENVTMEKLRYIPNEVLVMAFSDVMSDSLDFPRDVLLNHINPSYIKKLEENGRQARKKLADLKIKDFMNEETSFARAKVAYDNEILNLTCKIRDCDYQLGINKAFLARLDMYSDPIYLECLKNGRYMIENDYNIKFHTIISKNNVARRKMLLSPVEMVVLGNDPKTLLDKELSQKMDNILQRSEPVISNESRKNVTENMLK